jgi:CRP-like cAMP-binding protein
MGDHESLKAIRLFTGFDNDEIDAFINAANDRSVPEGHMFFAMGDRNNSLFVIRAGAVKAERLGTEDYISIATLEPGQTFGEMSFMDGSPATATVTTTAPTEFLEITRESLDQLLQEKPGLGVKLWRNFALDLKERLSRTNELVDHYIDINQVLLDDPSLADYFRENMGRQ